MELRQLTVPHGEMEYFSFGSGEDTYLVIPGLSLQNVMNSADAIAAAFADYTERYTVYVMDRVKTVPQGHTIRDMAQDIASVLEQLGLTQVDVFGASQGGMIAQWLAIDHPELVRKLVLGSTLCRFSPAGEENIQTWITLAKERNVPALVDSFAQLVYSADFMQAYGKLLTNALSAVTSAEVDRFARIAEGCIGFDTSARLKEITCPVLVIGSEADRVLFGDASRELALLLNCELYMYEGYSHAVYDEAPDYRQRVFAFLTA